MPESVDGFESHIDRIIREATERGEFDDLNGTGKPIPGMGTRDEDLWWVRRWAKRNLREDPGNPTDQESSNSP